jgi:putative flavoprotein involved in K+ transport
VVEQSEVIVIGAGQAGLVAGYFLSHADIPHWILDAGTRVGETWRRRWDSLELFTAARYSYLPGLAFPGDPEHFPGKGEVADYLDEYARTFELPVRLASRVTSIERSNAGYRLDTASGVYEATQVIVATGAYQRPRVPTFASKLSDDVVQLHTAEYRNPAQIRGETVLVVGAANSGAGIAADLADTHRVYLARGTRLPRVPRRILGKSIHWWANSFGFIAAPRASWRGRRPRGDVLIGPSLRQLVRRHGIELVGRTVDANGRIVRFDDGREIEVDVVVWATGYRNDYSWIRLPVLGEQGAPIHRRGVTDFPGLYFLGMPNQYSRGSSLIFWVKDDAAYIVDRVRMARNRDGR